MSEVIVMEAVTKCYRQGWRKPLVKALDEVSLRVEAGEVFGFIGPNGAGKSTAIKVLVGGLLEFTGNARLFGQPVGDPRSRRGMGYVPESASLQDYLTPLETLQMGRAMHGLAPDAARCRYWLERFGLDSVATRQIRTFSKGMAQRVALAHALAAEPRLLILDEPLSGLDPIGRRDVVDILADYRRDGGTIFLTSHVLHDVERLADRFGLIHQGRLRAVRNPGELVGDDDRVLVRSTGPASGAVTALADMVAEPGGRWVREVSRRQLWAVLNELEAAGHEIIEIRPLLSLETVFLQVVQGG